MATAATTVEFTQPQADEFVQHKVVRSIGPLGALAIGVQCISLVTAGILPFSTFAGLFPNMNLSGIISIAAGFSALIAIMYAAAGTVAPRSGADYVVSTRVLPAPLGFASSWAFLIFSAFLLGTLIAAIPRTIIPMFATTNGMIFKYDFFFQFAQVVVEPQNVITIGTIFLVLGFLMCILPSQTVRNLVLFGFVLSLLSWFVLYIQMISAPSNAFIDGWNQVVADDAYARHRQLAWSMGMMEVHNPGGLAVAGLLASVWMFFGSFAPTMMAGEVKRPGRTLLFGNLGAILIVWAILVGAVLLLQRFTLPGWISSESFVALFNSKGGAMPWIILYGAILQPVFPLVLFIAFAWLYSLTNMIQVYLMFASRTLAAWAQDGMLPKQFAYVHPRTKSPVVAILTVAVIAQLGLLDTTMGSGLSGQVNFIFFAACLQVVPVLAISLLPFLKKRLPEVESGLPGLKIGPVPVISVIGAATLIYLGLLIWFAIQQPRVAGNIGPGSLIALGVLFLSGIIWFYSRKRLLLKRGIEVNDVFAMIPKE